MSAIRSILKFATSRLANGEEKEAAPLKILVVDDSSDDLFLIQKAIQRCRHACHPVENLERAREALETSDYDGMLLDIKFQNGNGISFYQEISKLYPEMMTVFITGSLSREDVPSLPPGLTIIVIKPVQRSDLTLAVIKAMNIFAMDRTRRITLNARLSSISGTVLISLSIAFLCGRFLPQLVKFLDSIEKYLPKP